jgi:hypothetical protein
MKSLLALCCAAILLGGCGASHYGADQITGGYRETEVVPGVWRVGFFGNGYTTRETVQTFWLLRCAEFTLEKGYDGFEVVSDIRLASDDPYEGAFVPAKGGGGGFYMYQIQIYDTAKPILDADIKLLRKPIEVRPPKVFDAAELKARLEPLVKGKLCNGGNVCPHEHDYLKPRERS